MLKRYRVSLGVKIWTNWEVKVDATNEVDAQELAETLFADDNMAGEYTDPYYDDAELMGDDAVHVEEVEPDDDNEPSDYICPA